MQCKAACPLYPRKRTYAVQYVMSALGHKRTSPHQRDCDVQSVCANCGHKFNRPAEEPSGANRITRAVYQRLATMPPVMADGRHGTQIESRYLGNSIEPGPPFIPNRLQS